LAKEAKLRRREARILEKKAAREAKKEALREAAKRAQAEERLNKKEVVLEKDGGDGEIIEKIEGGSARKRLRESVKSASAAVMVGGGRKEATSREEVQNTALFQVCDVRDKKIDHSRETEILVRETRSIPAIVPKAAGGTVTSPALNVDTPSGSIFSTEVTLASLAVQASREALLDGSLSPLGIGAPHILFSDPTSSTVSTAPLSSLSSSSSSILGAKINKVVSRLPPGDSDAVAVWADRVFRFQEALASAFCTLQSLTATPFSLGSTARHSVALFHPAPFFTINFGGEAGGNVILFASAAMLLCRPGAVKGVDRVPNHSPINNRVNENRDAQNTVTAATNDSVVAIIGRSSPGLRLRLWTAGVKYTTPLDPGLLGFDLGLETMVNGLSVNKHSTVKGAHPAMAAEATHVVNDFPPLENMREGRVAEEVGSAPTRTARLSKSVLDHLSLHLGIGLGGSGSGDILQFVSAAAEIEREARFGGLAASAAPLTGESAAETPRDGERSMGAPNPSPPTIDPAIRGTPESPTTLLLVTQPQSVSALVQVLLESVMPGAQAATTSYVSEVARALGSGITGRERVNGGNPVPTRTSSSFVPLQSIALLPAHGGGGGGSTGSGVPMCDVPQILSLPALNFRHACHCDGEVSLGTYMEEGEEVVAAARVRRYALNLKGPFLPTIIPRLTTIVSAMCAERPANSQGTGGQPLCADASAVEMAAHPLLWVKAALSPSNVTFSFNSNYLHAALVKAFETLVEELGYLEGEVMSTRKVGEKWEGMAVTKEENLGLMLLPEVPWADLSRMEVRQRGEGVRKGFLPKVDQMSLLFKNITTTPFHGSIIPEPASMALEGVAFSIPIPG